VGKKYFLLNAVKPDRVQAVKDKMAGSGLEYLGAIDRDDALEEIMFRGESVYALAGSPAVRIIDEVMRKIGAG